MTAPLPVAICYEDRPDALVGLEILARSFALHAPGMELWAYTPSEDAGRRLDALPGVTWKPTSLEGMSWNVKPAIFRQALAETERVIWLDSDIVLIDDLPALLRRYDPEALVASEDFPSNAEGEGKARAHAFGFEAARDLPSRLNTGVVMVSRRHIDIIEAWSDALGSPAYRDAQAMPAHKRPPPLLGDQDALWATMLSERFADVPVEWVRRGDDIVLNWGSNGYRIDDRMKRLKGAKPAMVHMLGPYKPWGFTKVPSPFRRAPEYFHKVSFEVSPYFQAARRFRAELGHPAWLERRTLTAHVLNALSFGSPTVAGFPLALFASAGKNVGIGRARAGQPLGPRPD